MRGLDKRGGPARDTLSSWGFQRSHPFTEELENEFGDGSTYIDEFNGEKYICLIEYFVLKVSFSPHASLMQLLI